MVLAVLLLDLFKLYSLLFDLSFQTLDLLQPLDPLLLIFKFLLIFQVATLFQRLLRSFLHLSHQISTIKGNISKLGFFIRHCLFKDFSGMLLLNQEVHIVSLDLSIPPPFRQLQGHIDP